MHGDKVLDIIFKSNSAGETEAENSDSDIEDGDLSPDDELILRIQNSGTK